jgi:hypothetical protein
MISNAPRVFLFISIQIHNDFSDFCEILYDYYAIRGAPTVANNKMTETDIRNLAAKLVALACKCCVMKSFTINDGPRICRYCDDLLSRI